MPYDFPANPVDGQVYDNFVYLSSKQSWVSADSPEALAFRVNNAELLAPIGTIHMYAGSNAPAGYLLCEGQAVSRSEYARLFNQIGSTYGAGNGSTTFNIPDLRGRVAVGRDSSGTFANIAATGGAETHALDVTQIPSHTHIQNSHNHTQNSHGHGTNTRIGWGAGSRGLDWGRTDANSPATAWGAGSSSTTASNQSTTATNQNTGSSSPHNNLQPYNTVNYIIKF